MTTDASDPDRAAIWNRQSVVDAILNKGGMGVWFCRDEQAPRAAVRGRPGDFPVTLIELAMLRIGFDGLLDGIARAEGIDAAELRGMVEKTIPIVRERVDTATRITPRRPA